VLRSIRIILSVNKVPAKIPWEMFPPKSVPAKIIGLRYDSYVRHRALAENEYIISAFAECGGLLISASFPATHLSRLAGLLRGQSSPAGPL